MRQQGNEGAGNPPERIPGAGQGSGVQSANYTPSKLLASLLLLVAGAAGQTPVKPRPSIEAQLVSMGRRGAGVVTLAASVKITNSSPAYVFVLFRRRCSGVLVSAIAVPSEYRRAARRRRSNLRSFFQRDRVHAIAQPVRRGAIGKDVAKMRVAGVANRFDTLHPLRAIEAVRNGVACDRLRK